MATKTFSGRAEEKDLLFADALTHEQLGMSFGTYCATELIGALRQGATLPRAEDDALSRRRSAIARMKQLGSLPHDPAIGRMSDRDIKDLIASRYA